MTEAIGLDFGTTNTVAALADGAGGSELIEFRSAQASGATFRSALCFWEDSAAPGGIDSEAGPWAIEEFLETPSDCRFVQSFKSVVASPSFERALIFNRPFRFEDMGQLFLRKLVSHARGKLDQRPRRVIVGRPVEYAGAQGQGIIQGARVTVEGRAIARMLAATRRPDGDDLAPLDFPTLSAWNALDCGVTQEQREKIMAVQEAMGRALRYRFVREPVAGLPGIKLLGHEIGHNIPLTRVLWSLAFPDDYARDRLFSYLGDRLDRWQDWGRMAADGGSRALSEHLLKLKFAGEPINLE